MPAPNRLNQDFTAADPNRKWVSDFTYIDTAEGWLDELANAPSSSREQMVVVPIRTVQHLTRSTGQIAITAREALRLQFETSPVFSLPPPNWVPPYPYHRDEVLFSQSNLPILAHLPEPVRAWVPELATYEGA